MKVSIIAETKVDKTVAKQWLLDLGHSEKSIEPYLKHEVNAETLITLAGKRCYNSFSPEHNENISRVRTDINKYIYHILETAHGSVLEHVSFTFAIEDITLVATHELVRHRAGTAFSQQSLRFVRPSSITYRVPDCIKEAGLENIFVQNMQSMLHKYNDVCGSLDFSTMKMAEKKILTSALRRLLPNGIHTGIVFTSNLRTLLNVIQTRTQPEAEEEIRELFDEIGKLLIQKVPSLKTFFNVEDGTWMLPFASMPHDAKKLP